MNQVHGDVSHYKGSGSKNPTMVTFFDCACRQCDPGLSNIHDLLEARRPGPASVAKGPIRQ